MNMTNKTMWIGFGVAILIVAAAAVVGSIFVSSQRTVKPTTIQLTSAQQSKVDYDDALFALSKDDTATAIRLMERAVSLDSGNSAARSALAQLKRLPAVAATSTASASANPATDTGPFLGTIDLFTLLPASMEGFKLGPAQVAAPDAAMTGAPTVQGTGATAIVWAAHDRGTAQAAQSVIDGEAKGLYSQDQASVTVNGAPGYFGTDGARFATVAFRRGRYTFEVIVTATKSPAEVKSLAEKAAASFPTAP
jgi:hypothetical protein